MKVEDLMRLLLLSAPKQIGLKSLKDLFQSCYTPSEVSDWIDKIERSEIKIGPVKELLEVIYDLQKTDTEPPEIATVRLKLNEKLKKDYSKKELSSLINSLKVFLPGYVSIEGEKVGVQGRPDKVMEAINKAINCIPNELQQMYLNAFSSALNDSKNSNKKAASSKKSKSISR